MAAVRSGVLEADEDPAARGILPAIVGPGVTATVCEGGAEALWHAGRPDESRAGAAQRLPAGVTAMDVAAVLTRHHDGVQTIAVGVGVGEADRAGPVLTAGARRVVSRLYLAERSSRC